MNNPNSSIFFVNNDAKYVMETGVIVEPLKVFFSIIIPTLNRGQILTKAVASARCQLFPPNQYEIIVVDNGSTDCTKELIEQINQENGKPVYYVREERRGLQWARHTGAKVAKGNVLAYIDDDCVADPNWLAELECAYKELNADAAGGKILIRWDREPPSWVICYEEVLGKLDYGSKMMLLEEGQYINGGNFSIRRERLFEIGGFNPGQIGNYLIGDCETGLCDKIHKARLRMVWVPTAVVWHCQRVDQNATFSDIRRRFMNNGITNAYAMFKRQPKRRSYLINWSAKSFYHFVAYKALAIIYFAFRNHDVYYRYEFQVAYHKAQAIYYLRLIWDTRLRHVVLRDDWIN